MNEQQRLFVTMALCLGIFLAWQTFFPPPEPATVVATESAPSADTKSSPATDAAINSLAADAPAGASHQAMPALVRQVVETAHLRALLQNGDGSIAQLDLKDYLERVRDNSEVAEPVSLVAHTGTEAHQAQVRWQLERNQVIPLDFLAGTSSAATLRGHDEEGLELTMTVTPRHQAYALDYTLTAVNRGKQPRQVGAEVVLALTQHLSEHKSWFAPEADQVRAVCRSQNKLSRFDLEQASKKEMPAGQAEWVALDRQYFVAGLVPTEVDSEATCRLQREGQTLSLGYVFPSQVLPVGATYARSFSLYAGPKRDDTLAEVSPKLLEVIDYSFAKIPLGSLARPMVWLLEHLYELTRSWGLAIIFLTVLVKLVLFPFTYRSVVSMRKMQLLKPEIDRIRLQYKHDTEKQQSELFKTYRENGVNPVGGCLPMLLQMPVWATLYRTLWSSVDLYQQSFLWLPDLTAKEPFPFLALAVGAVTVLQQKLTPASVDNEQMRIMMIVMPLALTGFMIALPSGLVLYVLVNSVLTILQQMAINSRNAAA